MRPRSSTSGSLPIQAKGWMRPVASQVRKSGSGALRFQCWNKDGHMGHPPGRRVRARRSRQHGGSGPPRGLDRQHGGHRCHLPVGQIRPVGDGGRVRAEPRCSLRAGVYYLISPKKEDSLIFGIKLFVFNDLNSFLNSSIAIQRTYGRYSRVSYLFSTTWVHVRVQVSHSRQLTCIPAGSCTELVAIDQITASQQAGESAGQRIVGRAPWPMFACLAA